MSDNNLCCLSTGKIALHCVKNDLLTLQEKGSDWPQHFDIDSKEDPKKIKQQIKCRKEKHFANDAVKVKVLAKDKKLKEVKCTRDLFGRLFYLPLTQEFDLGRALSYSLLPSLAVLADHFSCTVKLLYQWTDNIGCYHSQ